MDELKDLGKKKFIKKDKRNTLISTKLNDEIKATQKLLTDLYKRKFKKRKAFTRVQASDFLAETYRRERYKIKNYG